MRCVRARGVVCLSHTLTLSRWLCGGCAAFSKAWSTTVGGGDSAKHAPSVSVVPVTAVWGGKGGVAAGATLVAVMQVLAVDSDMMHKWSTGTAGASDSDDDWLAD